MVLGSLARLRHVWARAGRLISFGSILSDTGYPLQGHYAASKHAVKGFTDALRMELEKKGTPVSVTLVKPGAIDTPYPQHARNYMEFEPKHPAPAIGLAAGHWPQARLFFRNRDRLAPSPRQFCFLFLFSTASI